jgi:hypothetical protein
MDYKVFFAYGAIVIPVISTIASFLAMVITMPLKFILFYHRSDDPKTEASVNSELWLRRGQQDHIFLLHWNQYLWHFIHTFTQSCLCIILSYIFFNILGLVLTLWIPLIFILWDIFFMFSQKQSWKQSSSSIIGYTFMYSYLMYFR